MLQATNKTEIDIIGGMIIENLYDWRGLKNLEGQGTV